MLIIGRPLLTKQIRKNHQINKLRKPQKLIMVHLFNEITKATLLAISAGVALMVCPAAAERTTTGSHSDVINISTIDDLNSIGRKPDFPFNGHYQQTNDIDASNFTESIPIFSGSYNGGCHAIDNLPIVCLITLSTVKSAI